MPAQFCLEHKYVCVTEIFCFCVGQNRELENFMKTLGLGVFFEHALSL